jgi:hypothetical protein
MIRFRRSKLIVLLYLLSAPVFAQEVDLFNEKNTADFAQFLFQSNQYQYASEEYERLNFMAPDNKEYQLNLLKSYRFANEYSKGINAFQHLVAPDLSIQQEYVKLNLLDKNKLNIRTMIGGLDPGSTFRNNLDLTLRLISIPDQPITLNGIQRDKIDEGLMGLYNESLDLKHRSPFVAGTMSMIFPGTGKVYCGRWKDGLMSLIFVGTTAFQAYRGFYKKGTQSVYGWIMGGVSLGFYIGNIYGSAKAAKVYNAHQNTLFIDKTTDYYIDHF